MGRLSHAITYDEEERAPKGREPYGERPHSSRGSNDPPRKTGKPSAGPRGPGDRTFNGREVCEMLAT